MQGDSPSYSITVTADEVEELTDVVYRSCIRQNQAFEDSALQRVGMAGRLSEWQIQALLLLGAVISTLLLAMTKTNEVFGRLCCGGLATFFWSSLVAVLVFGQDRIKAAIRKLVTNPLIRGTVHLELRRAIKLAPFSVVYHFHENHYTACMCELKTERSISLSEITVAYQEGPVFCLFEGNASRLKAAIYAREPKQRNIVENALKRNEIELRNLDADCIKESA